MPSEAPVASHDVRVYAQVYADLGWPIVAIPCLSKGPTRDGWQSRHYTPDDFAPGDNVGIKVGVPGPSGVVLVDIDCDCPEAIALAPSILPATCTFGRLGDGKTPPAALTYAQAGPRRHWIYQWQPTQYETEPPDARNPKHAHTELRSQSRRGLATQTMAPGSIHPETHELVQWIDWRAPAVVTTSQIECAHRRLAIATVVARAWASPSLEGQRHDACLAFAGALWHAGWTLDEALAVLLPAWSLDGNDAPHREQAIIDTWDDSGRQRWGMPSLKQLISVEHADALERLIGDKALGLQARAAGGAVVVQGEAHAPQDIALPPLNDEGNASILMQLHGEDWRHVEGVGWLRWSGRWTRDEHGPYAEAIELSRRYAALADQLGGPAAKEVRQWSRACGMAPRLQAALEVLARNPAVSRTLAQLDADPMLLGTPSGVVDLRQGTVREATRDDLITRCTNVAYEPDAVMPERFGRFVGEVMGGSVELASYLLRYLGHCLTGDTSEHVFAIWHGSAGGNGKSTLLGLMMHILGEYACTIAPSLLTHASTSQHPAGLMDLQGRRLAYTSETGENQRWNEALVKQLTGGDDVRARPMYGSFVQFRASAKIVVATNSRPLVRESGAGFWRRVHLLPWLQTWTGREDRSLAAQLEHEAPGILRWLVHACVEWQRVGLAPPNEVRAAGDDYRESQDTIGAFLRECVATHENGWIGRPELFGAYRRWTEMGGEYALGRTAFHRVLQDRGWVLITSNGARGYRGVRLLPGAV